MTRVILIIIYLYFVYKDIHCFRNYKDISFSILNKCPKEIAWVYIGIISILSLIDIWAAVVVGTLIAKVGAIICITLKFYLLNQLDMGMKNSNEYVYRSNRFINGYNLTFDLYIAFMLVYSFIPIKG